MTRNEFIQRVVIAELSRDDNVTYDQAVNLAVGCAEQVEQAAPFDASDCLCDIRDAANCIARCMRDDRHAAELASAIQGSERMAKFVHDAANNTLLPAASGSLAGVGTILLIILIGLVVAIIFGL